MLNLVFGANLNQTDKNHRFHLCNNSQILELPLCRMLYLVYIFQFAVCLCCLSIFFFRVCKRWREYSSTEMHINIYREKKRENDENVICLQSEITIGNFVAKSKSSFYAIDTIESNFMCQTRCTMHNFINKSFDSFYNIGQLVFNHEFVVYM